MGREVFLPLMHPAIASLSRRRLRWLLYIAAILMMANLSALMDLFIAPQVPYFNREHLYVGVASGLLIVVLIVTLELYLGGLQRALAQISRIESFLSVCSACGDVRLPDPENSRAEAWVALDRYIQEHTSTRFSHGICPDCARRLYSPYLGRRESGKGVAASDG